MSVRRLDPSQRKRTEELVERHKIVFRVAAAREPFPEGIVAVGFDVELAGAHGPGAGPIMPGCPKCRAVWEDLEEVSRAIVPEGVHASQYERKEFDRALQSGGKRSLPFLPAKKSITFWAPSTDALSSAS